MYKLNEIVPVQLGNEKSAPEKVNLWLPRSDAHQKREWF